MAAPEDREGSLSPEIERLSAQVAGEPGSRVFLLLAELYLKAGMAPEAISTLENGLKTIPHYMSAKVLLGKAYLENGEAEKAREQFEAVVKANPDNLVAQRKLGEIYLGIGMYAEAARSFKIITLLNPRDEEAAALLKDAESPRAEKHDEPAPEQAEDEAPEPQAVPMFDISETDAAGKEPEPGSDIPLPPDQFAAAHEVPEPEPQFPAAKIDAEDSEAPEPEPEVLPEAEIPEVIDTLPEPDVFPEMDPLPEAEIPTAAAEETEGPMKGYGMESQAQAEAEDIFAAYRDASADEEQNEEPVYEITDDISSLEIDGVDFQPSEERTIPQPAPESAGKEAFETETLAELYITQGFYDRAINIYKNLIVESPADMRLRQKLEDLYLLVNIGKRNRKEEPAAPAEDSADIEVPQVLQDGSSELPEYDAMNSWEFYGEEEKKLGKEAEPPQTGAESGNLEAVDRLGKFLDKIRRKAGQ